MAALVLAVLQISDQQAYDRYAAAFPAVFARHNGQIVCADASPERLHGRPADKIVIMSFPDPVAAKCFLEDPEYLAISEDRRQGANVEAWLVQGFA